MKNQRNRLRKNIKQYADYDYISKLSPEDKDFMKKFEDEYYCGSYNKENSLHKEAFGDEYNANKKPDKNVKQSLSNQMNAQNRDLMGIAGCSNKLVDLETVAETLQEDDYKNIQQELVTKTPNELMEEITTETADEITTEPINAIDTLKEYALKIITIYLLAKKETERQKRMERKEKLKKLKEIEKNGKMKK